MAGKNLINSVDDAVNESLMGFTLTYPHLELHSSKRVILKRGWDESNDKVSIVCGGGSGHEPFTSGFVGDGMLTASVSGSIFASPPTRHIFYAIKRASEKNNNAGCLVIIANYTGDVLNFGLAIEKARNLGLKVSQVTVGEDCSIPDEEINRAGKRGLPGIVLVMKISGALAARGHSLEDIKNYSEFIVNNMATTSVCLTAATMPHQGRMFEIPDDEFEFGLGVHGEAGYQRIKSMSSRDSVALMLRKIENTLKLVKGNSVVVSINNFGGLSQLEQAIVAKEAVAQLGEKGISVLRVYSGTLMSSLDGVGVHLTILNLPKNEQLNILKYLDDPTDAPKWPGCSYSQPISDCKKILDKDNEELTKKNLIGPVLTADHQRLFKSCLKAACDAIVTQERFINDLDRGCGDGDCGTTLKYLAEGVTSMMDKLPWSHPASLLNELADIAEDRMGGTSGAIYSLMFITAATEMSEMKSSNNWIDIWSRASCAGVDGICKYSKAMLGDKTMLDVLKPTVEEFKKSSKLSFDVVVENLNAKAIQTSEATKNMIPRAGRASYVKQADYCEKFDAGAYAVMIWINAIVECLKKN